MGWAARPQGSAADERCQPIPIAVGDGEQREKRRWIYLRDTTWDKESQQLHPLAIALLQPIGAICGRMASGIRSVLPSLLLELHELVGAAHWGTNFVMPPIHLQLPPAAAEEADALTALCATQVGLRVGGAPWGRAGKQRNLPSARHQDTGDAVERHKSGSKRPRESDATVVAGAVLLYLPDVPRSARSKPRRHG